MSWYVFALVDRVPRTSAGKGLSAPVAFRRAGPGFAAVERRADVPPLELGSLQAHQRVVERIARDARAILPVRFGTLLTTADIDESLADREDELEEAFALVRERRQMTWRLRTPRKAVRGQRPAGRSTARTLSGAEYLENALRVTKAPASGTFRRIADGVGSLSVAERYQQRTHTLPDALYHLVDRAKLDAYETASKRMQTASPAAVLSGPWAPYAFVPELF